MNILGGIGRWLLALIVIFSVTTWIGVVLLQTTLLNRPMVFGWLDNSKVYDNALDAAFKIKPEGNGQGVVSQTVFQKAADAVFTPSYVKQQTQNVLNSVYDWAEGTKPSITFSIPVNEARDAFSAALAKELTAEFSKLPACQAHALATSEPTCIPQGMTAAQMAAQSSQLDASDGNFLTKPITQDTLGNSQTTSVAWAPALVATARWAVIALPILALVCATGFVLLSDNKLLGLGAIGKHVFFYTILLAMAGAALWIFGSTLSLASFASGGSTQDGSQIIAKIIDPLLHQALPDIGRMLALFSGGVALLGLAAWVTGRMIHRKNQQPLHISHTPKQKGQNPPQQPEAPAQSPTGQPPQAPPSQS